MKRSIAIIIVILSAISLKAQINPKLIYGNWIKIKTTYSDDVELPDVLPSKYIYTRYTFTNPNKVNIAIGRNSQGLINNFVVNDSVIAVVSATGFTINEFRISKLTADEMVLEQKGGDGFNDPRSFKFYLIPESLFQRKAKFYPDEISKLSTGDTVYRESRKVYATFKGDEDLLHYLSQHNNDAGMDGQEGVLRATFIVSKTGGVDSLKILHGINSDYDKQFVKWFNKNKKNWQPAKLNGQPVNVIKTIEQRYFLAGTITSFTRYSDNAYSALLASDYQKALFFYNQSLTIMPYDIENIYRRAICKIALGISDGVCEDLEKVRMANTMLIDELFDKYCRSAVKN